MNNKNNEIGFWIRIWMEWGRGHSTLVYDYKFLLFEDGYEKDEETLKDFAHDWAQYEKHGADLDRYKYGYEIVDKPPKEWLDKELKKLLENKDNLMKRIDFIKKEINVEDL